MNEHKGESSVEPALKDEDAVTIKRWWQKREKQILAVGSGIIIVGLALTLLTSDGEDKKSVEAVISPSVHAGKQLSNQQCENEGVPYKLSRSPMDIEDFSMIQPYGLMVADHVTPIDHQYFSPADYKSKPDAYEVYAMADSHVVDIGGRPKSFGDEYRIVFSVSCTYFYYYDLVTSLSPELKAAYDKYKNKGESIKLPVKAGQLIGRIGGQTLDFAVWDTTKKLAGFIVPEHYKAESWKLYTVDPLDYYTDELKAQILPKYPRSTPPISGKIDYDVDGRLIGNWFREGANGYAGFSTDNTPGYKAHLSFASEFLDPTWFIISIGDYFGQPKQFVAKTNSPKPMDVSAVSGLAKYDLTQWSYIKPDGKVWDRVSFAKDLSILPSDRIEGCALAQVIETRKIKFESIRGKACSQVAGFTDEAVVYTR